MPAADSPCEPWTTAGDVAQGDCAPDVGEFDEDLLTEAATIASAWLYRLSGRKYRGTCTATVRPQQAACGCGYAGWTTYGPTVDSWTATTNQFWCGCRYGRRRENVTEVTLGYWPVVAILDVTVDGGPIGTGRYRLDDNRWLVLKDGIQPAQNMALDAGEPGTWTVTFTHGVDPPPDGRFAARVLACEIARWQTGGDCRIPKRATNLARQGVNIALIDPSGLLENGRFGVPEVDAFLNTVNPNRLRRGPAILNVDIGRPVRPAASAPGS